MSGYRLIVSDLDGTLRAEGSTAFSPRVRAAVAEARARGIRVVIATGRMFRSAEPFARDLGVTEPMICNQGATIYDLTTRATIYDQRVAPPMLREILEFAGSDMTPIACLDGEFYSERIPEAAARLAAIYARDHFHQVANLLADLPRDPQKVMFVNDAAITERLHARLVEHFAQRLQVVRSFERYVELTHGDASKGNAVKWLSAQWNIPRAEIIAIGDQDNDRSMLEYAGLGVAMGNAIEGLKSVAQYVAPSAAEDGAAVVIEKFVLGRGQTRTNADEDG